MVGWDNWSKVAHFSNSYISIKDHFLTWQLTAMSLTNAEDDDEDVRPQSHNQSSVIVAPLPLRPLCKMWNP